MKTKFTIPKILLFAAILLQSCAVPKSIVRLEPNREPDKWLYGQAFISDSIYGIHYEVAFDRLEDNRYLFDFHITNRSNMPILIDPATFYCMPFDGSMAPLVADSIAAIDPEMEILTIDKNMSRNEARRKNQLGVALAAVGVGVVTAIITNTDDNPHNDYLGEEIADDMIDEARISDIENTTEAFNLNDLRDLWSTSTIRKTTLESNYAMYGKVFFPAFPQTTYFKIYLPVDDNLIEFTFKQIQFPAN